MKIVSTGFLNTEDCLNAFFGKFLEIFGKILVRKIASGISRSFKAMTGIRFLVKNPVVGRYSQ